MGQKKISNLHIVTDIKIVEKNMANECNPPGCGPWEKPPRFQPKQFSKSLVPTPGKVYTDPWMRFEAWRYQPEFRLKAHLPRIMPGWKYGVAAFIVAIGIEEIYYKYNPQEDAHHH